VSASRGFCVRPATLRAAAGASGGPVVACLEVDEFTTVVDAVSGENSLPDKARLVVVDAASGAVVSDVATDPSTSLSSIDGDLVTGRIDVDGRVRITRTDPRGAGDRWTFVGPDRVGVKEGGHQIVGVSSSGGIVVAQLIEFTGQGATGASWALSGEGKVIRVMTGDLSTGSVGWFDVVHGGKWLVEQGVGVGPSATTVVDVATGRSFVVDAGWSGAGPDDGIPLHGHAALRARAGERAV